MAQITKKLITEAALRLAEKKPLNKITVRDITGECGITRNTFYYYFHDIYDVFITYIENRMTEIYENSSDETALFDFMELAAEYKKVWVNCYKTVGHERLSKFAGEKIRSLIIKTFDAEGYLGKIPEADLDIICTFYEEALFGLLMRWLQDKMSDDPERMKLSLDRIRILFEGQLELLAKNSQNSQKS